MVILRTLLELEEWGEISKETFLLLLSIVSHSGVMWVSLAKLFIITNLMDFTKSCWRSHGRSPSKHTLTIVRFTCVIVNNTGFWSMNAMVNQLNYSWRLICRLNICFIIFGSTGSRSMHLSYIFQANVVIKLKVRRWQLSWYMYLIWIFGSIANLHKLLILNLATH